MNTQASSPSSGTEPGGSPAGQAGPPGAGHGAPPADQFFHRLRGLGVVRPDEGRWAAGVCAGLARRWGMDPLLVRGLFVVVGIVGGFGLGLYGMLWLFLPHPDGRIHAQQVLRGVVTAGFVGASLFVLADLPFSGAWGWNRPGHPFGGVAFLVLVGLGIWWLVTKDSRKHGGGPGGPIGSGGSGFGPGPSSVPGPGPDAPVYGSPAPEAPRPGGPETDTTYGGTTYAPGTTYAAGSSTAYAPTGYAPTAYAPAPGYAPVVTAPRPVDVHKPLHALTLTFFGFALVAAAGVLGWDRWISDIRDAGLVATAVALGVIALGVVLAGLLGRRSGGLAPIALLLALVTAGGASAQDGVHDVQDTLSWTPATAVAATSGYNLSTGRAVLDLTQPGLVTGATTATPVTIPASVGAGELVVIVPNGVSTRVEASVGLGAVSNRVDGTSDRGGPNVTETISSGPNPVLVVNAKVGLGHVQVVRQGTEVAR